MKVLKYVGDEKKASWGKHWIEHGFQGSAAISDGRLAREQGRVGGRREGGREGRREGGRVGRKGGKERVRENGRRKLVCRVREEGNGKVMVSV